MDQKEAIQYVHLIFLTEKKKKQKTWRNIESDDWLLRDIEKRDGKLEISHWAEKVRWYPPSLTKVYFAEITHSNF